MWTVIGQGEPASPRRCDVLRATVKTRSEWAADWDPGVALTQCHLAEVDQWMAVAGG